MKASSAANRVGPSASFGAIASPLSARSQMIETVVGVGKPVQAPLDRLTVNPLNPRESFDEEYLEGLAANLREVGQIQPATVMTRLAFFAAHPEYEGSLPDADYVILDGHCRLMAAQRIGLEHLKIAVDDSAAGTPEDILAAALSVNHFRKDLSPIEEAQALEILVDRHGSAAAVAEILGGPKMNGWISQRRALLKLPEDVQIRVHDGEIPLRIARKAGSLEAEEQRQFIEENLAARKAEQEKPKPLRGRAAAAASKASPPAPRSEAPTPAAEPRPDSPAAAVPPQAPAPGTSSPLRPAGEVDWSTPQTIADSLRSRLTQDELAEVVEHLMPHL
ncbi:ParB/RepB/Spo0J family partition protein [Streptomyces sp. NPDC007369]|uniref:ParB/RepB/Spo0J family partition protein n=1 Tax=Streptomyces sp. NPDC007369 TaxID=3154589 RepID=UPI0033E830B7